MAKKGKQIPARYFNANDLEDQDVDTIKRIIAQIAIFYPVKEFEKYLDANSNSDFDVVKKYPYLIFSHQRGGQPCRMRRINEDFIREYRRLWEGSLSEEEKSCQPAPEDVRRNKYLIDPYKFFESDEREIIKASDNGNSCFNREFASVLSNAYGHNIPKGKYEICHIGGNTVHHLDYFAAIPNIVYVPRWFAGATDHLPAVRRFLAGISYRLYGEILRKKCRGLVDLNTFYGIKGVLSPREDQGSPSQHVDPKDLLTEKDVSIWNTGRKKFLKKYPFSEDYRNHADPWENGEGKLA